MRTTAEEKKRLLLNDLAAARRSIMDAAARLPTECLEAVFLGEWSIRDILAHLIGWDHTNRQAAAEILSGRYPSFFQHYDKDWASYNRELVMRYRHGTGEELLSATENAHRQLLDYLESLPANAIIGGKARSETGRTVTIRRLLIAETRDERDHARQIADFWESFGPAPNSSG